MVRRLAIGAGMMLALFLLASPAAAHTYLVDSDPADGQRLRRAPSEVVLEFSERPESAFGGVRVEDPSGRSVAQGEPEADGVEIRVRLRELTEPGRYRITYRLISADGHPVDNRLSFVFDPPTPTPSPDPDPTEVTRPSPTATAMASEPASAETEAAEEAPSEPMTPDPPDGDGDDDGDMAGGPVDEGGMPMGSSAGLWISRLASYLSLTAIVGLLLLAAFLLPGDGRLTAAGRRASLLAAAAGGVWALSAAALFIFGLSQAEGQPLARVLDGESLRQYAGTRFGMLMLLQIPAALIIAAVAALSRHRRSAAAALVITSLAALIPVWSGHAGTNERVAVAVACDWAHMLGVTAWVGGLAALVLLTRRPGAEGFTTPVARFSTLAGWALAVVLASGIVTSTLHMTAVDQLWTTGWGRLLLIKVALFAVIAALGALNRFRVLPRLRAATDEASARAAFRRVAFGELGLMVLAFGAATSLATSLPAATEAASRTDSEMTSAP